MFPVLFEIGSFKIHSFGVMVAIGILVGSHWLAKEAQRLGDAKITEEKIQKLVWYMVLAVIGGGRLMHVIVEHKHYLKHPLRIFAVWEGGLVFYGGFLAVFFTVVGFARKHKIGILRLCDLIAPSAFLGQSIGRWGCFLVGDDYGKPTDAWVGVVFTNPQSLIPEHLRGVPLHPAQIYMSVKAFLIFLGLTWITRRKKFDGQVAGMAFILYAILRSFIEFFRGDEDRGFVGPLSTAQFTSLFGFLLGLSLLLFAPRRTLADEPAQPVKNKKGK